MGFIHSLAWGKGGRWSAIRKQAWTALATSAGEETYVEDTATGNPVTFSTDVAKALTKCEVAFTPVQSGSGDPSPENVRPITGWTGVDVYRTGKNLFDASTVERRDGYLLNDQGQEQTTTVSGYTKSITPVSPGATYTFDGSIISKSEEGYYWRLYYYDKNGTFVSRTSSQDRTQLPYTFTVPSGCYGIAFQYNMSQVDFSTFMLELGSSATAYAPYSGTSYPVTFPAEAGTVYCGSLDLTTGVLTVTHYLVQAHKSDFGNEQTGEINYRNIMLQERVPRPSSGVSWNKARETQCLNYGKIANPYSETTYGNYVGVMLYAQSTSTIFRISSPLYDALSDDDEITICYEIAESYTVQLTPQQITSFIGDNTIWSDANGDLTVKYLKKG